MKNSLTVLLLVTSLAAFSQRNKKNDFEKENFFRVGFNAGININRILGNHLRTNLASITACED